MPQGIKPSGSLRSWKSLQQPEQVMPRFEPGIKLELPSPFFWELKQGLMRIEKILANSGVSIQELIQKFKVEVGPRVDPRNENLVLKGLALSDYSFDSMMGSSPPWPEETWREHVRLHCLDLSEDVPGDSPLDQVRWIGLRLGAFRPFISVSVL